MMRSLYRRRGRSRHHSIAGSVIGAALCLLALGGCSDSTAPAGAVSGSFVGVAQGTDVLTLVAVHVGEPDGFDTRQITVYACHSKELGTSAAIEITGLHIDGG